VPQTRSASAKRSGKYQAANLEKLREKDREVARKQYIKNRGRFSASEPPGGQRKEEIAAYRRQWYAKNKDRLAAKRAAKRAALSSAFTNEAGTIGT
jgi:hypothetical protein